MDFTSYDHLLQSLKFWKMPPNKEVYLDTEEQKKMASVHYGIYF